MSIVNDFNSIYEKHAKDIFNIHKEEEHLNTEKINYEKYFNKSLSIIEEINLNKIGEECAYIENEVATRVSQLENVENTIRDLLFKGGEINENYETKDKNMKLGLSVTDSFLTTQADYNDLLRMNNIIREKLGNISTKLENLENQSIDSIKKMKKLYENQDEMQIKSLQKLISENKRELQILNASKREKLKILDDKNEIHSKNIAKVKKFEEEYEVLEEKYEKANHHQQLVLEELNSFQINYNLVETQIKSLQDQLQIKELNPSSSILPSKPNLNSKINLCHPNFLIQNKIKYKLRPVESKVEEMENVKMLITDISTQIREIENSQMAYEDHLSIKIKEKIKLSIENENKSNILSLIGIMMNCLHLKKKSVSQKEKKQEILKNLSEINSIMSDLEEITSNEKILRRTVESYMQSFANLEKLKLKEKNHLEILNKI